MIGTSIFFYILIMWILIIAGGGLLVAIIAPISVQGYGNLDHFIDSIIKAAIALLLVVIWILLMSKIKNWIFHNQVNR